MQNGKKLVLITKYLLAGVTVFYVSWIACVSEWRVRAASRPQGLPTMRTIVAYSEGKLAQLDRPNPVTCDRLPALPQIRTVNRTWTPNVNWRGLDTWQQVPGAKVSLFQAYYDERQKQHYVRIIASFPGQDYADKEQLYCQTRQMDDDATVEIVAAKPQEIWKKEWNTADSFQTAVLLSCPLTEPLRGSSIVSIVTETCEDPSNAFILEPSKKITTYERKFTICVKDLHFDKDISRNLVEWIEINALLGVNKIDMYVDKVHKKTVGILEHYRNTGFLRLFHVPINHDMHESLWQRRRDHLVSYNDCLYRNIMESEYIIPLDVDEVLIPKIADDLRELTQRLRGYGWEPSESAAALVQNVFFFDFMQDADLNKNEIYVKRDDVRLGDDNNLQTSSEISENVIDNKDIYVSEQYKVKCGRELNKPKVVTHTSRSAYISPKGSFTKSLMVTKRVLMAFNHYPLASIGSNSFDSNYWFAPFREVQLNHYKELCNKTLVTECPQYEKIAVKDYSALRLRDRLLEALANSPCADSYE